MQSKIWLNKETIWKFYYVKPYWIYGGFQKQNSAISYQNAFYKYLI